MSHPLPLPSVTNNPLIGNIKKMLLSTDWSIQQVADVMGFPDQASLGQFFKRNEGVSPLAFRKSFR